MTSFPDEIGVPNQTLQNLPEEGPKRAVTGKLVVSAMFVMGITATAFLYGYWTLHLMPFMPLQEAIVREFPGSAPRVDGGQRKIHKETPKILRIVMKWKSDPTAEDETTAAELERLRGRIEQLVKAHVSFPDLEIIELYVYRLQQEEDTPGRAWELHVGTGSSWQKLPD